MLCNFCVCIAFFNLWRRGFNQKEEKKNAANNLKTQTNTTIIPDFSHMHPKGSFMCLLFIFLLML